MTGVQTCALPICTETSATHTPDHLFAPGSYTFAVWNPAEGITVNGTTATIAAATGTRAGTDAFVNNALGWFFTYTEQVTICLLYTSRCV